MTEKRNDAYHHYLRMVKILEKLKREGDLEYGPKLLDRILDAQKDGQLEPGQAMELSERVQRWLEHLQDYFTSQEYRMKKLVKALEKNERQFRKSGAKKGRPG
jgi:hypothetical protein